MYNIRINFGKFYRICKEIFEEEVDQRGNLQLYRRIPNMSDLQVISLSCMMEALGIDSENLLWSKPKTDYRGLFPNLICRTRFNRRRKRLSGQIVKVQDRISERLEDQSQMMVIDSAPILVVKMARERTYKAFRKDFETVPSKGYSVVNKG